MASPFNIFRRNQRIMMVVLTGLSMFAFLFFDVTTMKSGGASKALTVALFAALCGLGLWYVGSRRGQGSEWALWGAVLGGVAAFLFVRSTGTESVIQGKGIQVTDSSLRKLAERRVKVNRFVYEAGRVTKAARPAQGFGATDDRSMLQFVMGQKEAQRLGVSLTDAAVNRYLKDVTDDKLSKREFTEILRDLGLSEGDLFSYLREELEVRLALGVQTPPYDSWLDFDPQSRQMYYRPMHRATPEEQWQYFCRMNVKESLSVVALPVNAFMTKVEEPSDKDLELFFELAKGKLPGMQGEPGFLQPHRVQVAYLSADFDKFESQAVPPTDDDITAYYEQNKDARYRIREIPENDLPADATVPENLIPAFPAPEEPSSEDSPSDDAPKDGEAAPKDGDTKPKDGDASAAGPTSPIRLVSLTVQEEESSETPAKEKAGETETPDEPSDTKPKLPEMDDEDEDFPVDLPSPGGEDKTQVRYRDLDDELRDTIRIQILRDRAYAKMGEAADKAQKMMEDKSFQYQGKDEKEQAALAKEFAVVLKEYAVNHGLNYVETSLMSELELQNSTNEKIGAALLATENPSQFQVMTVLDDLFPQGGQAGPSYVPQRADSRIGTQRFAYWKILDVPQHVPELKESGVKDQVLTAWKFQKAREMTQRRAQTLLELAKEKPNDLSAALAGQTVTGEPGTAGVVIKETPRFSWLTTESTTPANFFMGDSSNPRLSFIDGVDQQGEDFMRTVFEELKVGETGLAMNYPRTVAYLVQVRERDAVEPVPDGVEGYKSADELRHQFFSLIGSDRLGFATRAYNVIMTNSFMRLQQEWMKSFDQRYGIEQDALDPANRGMGRRTRPQ